jgi:endonuclease YncB( thermonuclease family)
LAVRILLSYLAAAVVLAASGLAVGLISADVVVAANSGRFVYAGVVTKVVDGDTLDVRLASGKRERVRLIGIDTPERGACYFTQAGNRARLLALNNEVTLRGDATQETRDRYGRLLAYVDIAGGTDLGATLIREGYGQVYVYSRPFSRLKTYGSGQTSAKTGRLGLWGACKPAVVPIAPTPPVAPTTTVAPPPTTTVAPPPATTVALPPTATAPAPPSGGCHPNYSKCLPIVGDLDCADIRAMGKAPVQVIGADPYRLDGDNDGLGCE